MRTACWLTLALGIFLVNSASLPASAVRPQVELGPIQSDTPQVGPDARETISLQLRLRNLTARPAAIESLSRVVRRIEEESESRAARVRGEIQLFNRVQEVANAEGASVITEEMVAAALEGCEPPKVFPDCQ